jgi:ATP-dependent helicase IRC3
MGVSLPTGSGKTTIFMSLIPRIVEREGRRKQTLILVNAIELATQAEAAARRLLSGDWSVEMEQGNNKASGLADV